MIAFIWAVIRMVCQVALVFVLLLGIPSMLYVLVGPSCLQGNFEDMLRWWIVHLHLLFRLPVLSVIDVQPWDQVYHTPTRYVAYASQRDFWDRVGDWLNGPTVDPDELAKLPLCVCRATNLRQHLWSFTTMAQAAASHVADRNVPTHQLINGHFFESFGWWGAVMQGLVLGNIVLAMVFWCAAFALVFPILGEAWEILTNHQKFDLNVVTDWFGGIGMLAGALAAVQILGGAFVMLYVWYFDLAF